MSSLQKIQNQVIRCKKCPRLIEHCLEVKRVKRKSYANDDYWGKPVPGFGDPQSEILIVGLAPAAHGANRTGRMFTGDRSGDWLYRALYKAGLATQAESTWRDDGLELINSYITSVAHCAPPFNKPTTEEISNCWPYLEKEFALLKNLKVVIALGGIAFNGIWPLLRGEDQKIKKPKFGHAEVVRLPGPTGPTHLVMSYHPSQQNTFTGRLTEPMFDQVFKKALKQLRH